MWERLLLASRCLIAGQPRFTEQWFGNHCRWKPLSRLRFFVGAGPHGSPKTQLPSLEREGIKGRVITPTQTLSRQGGRLKWNCSVYWTGRNGSSHRVPERSRRAASFWDLRVGPSAWRYRKQCPDGYPPEGGGICHFRPLDGRHFSGRETNRKPRRRPSPETAGAGVNPKRISRSAQAPWPAGFF
jgi:hypothetical protein